MQKKILLPLAVVIVLGIGVVGYVLIQKGKTPVSQEGTSAIATSENKDDSSNSIAPKEGWKSYSSSKLGISFQYPEKTLNPDSSSNSKCTDKDGFTPIKVTEDTDKGAVYLTYGCLDTLESLRNETVNATANIVIPHQITKPSYGWKIITKKIQNDSELNTFVKDLYGKGCYISEREEQSPKGVYKLTIKGEDWEKEGIDLGNTTCPWSEAYELLQATNSNTIVSINRDGEATFYSNSGDVEGEILSSIRFN